MTSANNTQDLARLAQMQTSLGGGPLEAPGEGGTGSSVGAGDIWRIVNQRKLTVSITFILVYALVVVTTFVVYRYFPAFPAEAMIELKAAPEDAFAVTDPMARPDVMELQLQSEAQKIKQLTVLQDVLSLPEIQQTDFFKWYDSFDECLYDLENQLRVSVVRGTQLISVQLACRNKSDARRIVDAVVSRYIERYQRQSQESTHAGLKDLKDRVASMELELAAKQEALASFREQSDVPAMESEREVLVDHLTMLNNNRSVLDSEIADYQAQLENIRGIDPRDLPVSPEMRVIVEADPTLRFFRQQVEGIDIQIQAALNTVFGARHRSVKLLRAQRDAYYEKEVARREELLDDLRERQVDSLDQNLARLRAVQARLMEEITEAEANLRDLDSALLRYQTLVKDEERLQENLLDLSSRVVEAQHMADMSPKRARLQVVQRPKEAVSPSRPNIPLYLGGGFVFALAAGLGLAFLRELTDKAIRTPVDVARYGNISVLGYVPLLDDEEADIDTIEVATRDAPHSLVAEAFRQIRANLIFSGPAEQQRTILVTSPSPGDGKTAAAINLAVTMAQSNQRVLLVDCNFRRPALRENFPNSRAEGLSNILIGQVELGEVAAPSGVNNLDVLSSGPMPPTPAELLSSEYMRDFIAKARETYDRVVFDGPPILLISDALVLATQVDGSIMVCRAVSNSKGALRRARDQLDRINARVYGAILNGAHARAGGYFRRQYQQFYDYTSDETIPRELPGFRDEENGYDEEK